MTVSKSVTKLTLKPSRTLLAYGQALTLTAKLAGGGTGVRPVRFYRVTPSGAALLGTDNADVDGIASFTLDAKHNEKYVARFAGDDTWLVEQR